MTLVLVLSLGAAWLLLPPAMTRAAQDAASRSALQTAKQFKVVRGYYTRNVIGPAKASGALKPSIDHANNDNAIPLPATMIHDLCPLLASSSITLSLYSAYPFPNRADRVLGDFQTSTWDFLSQNPDAVFERLEQRDGKTVLRVAIADQLVAPGCVACHNSFAGSPKTDWQLDDVRGVLEIDSGEIADRCQR